MTPTKYKDEQDFFDNSTTEEKIRIISNNIEEWQIIPTRRGQFICSSFEDGMKEQGAGYIFRAKIEDRKGKIKWYQICVSSEFDKLIKIAYYKLSAYIENNIYI